MANSGDMQIGLIEQRCQTPSMYLDFLDNGVEGLQHISFWLDDYDAAHRQALEMAISWGTKDSTSRAVCIFQECRPSGTVFEFNEITSVRRQLIDTIKQAAPIRRS